MFLFVSAKNRTKEPLLQLRLLKQPFRKNKLYTPLLSPLANHLSVKSTTFSSTWTLSWNSLFCCSVCEWVWYSKCFWLLLWSHSKPAQNNLLCKKLQEQADWPYLTHCYNPRKLFRSILKTRAGNYICTIFTNTFMYSFNSSFRCITIQSSPILKRLPLGKWTVAA